MPPESSCSATRDFDPLGRWVKIMHSSFQHIEGQNKYFQHPERWMHQAEVTKPQVSELIERQMRVFEFFQQILTKCTIFNHSDSKIAGPWWRWKERQLWKGTWEEWATAKLVKSASIVPPAIFKVRKHEKNSEKTTTTMGSIERREHGLRRDNLRIPW